MYLVNMKIKYIDLIIQLKFNYLIIVQINAIKFLPFNWSNLYYNIFSWSN